MQHILNSGGKLLVLLFLGGLLAVNIQVGTNDGSSTDIGLFGFEGHVFVPTAAGDILDCTVDEQECQQLGGLWFPEDECCLIQTGTDPCPEPDCDLQAQTFCCMDSGIRYNRNLAF